MEKVLRILRTPGGRQEIQCAAATQVVETSSEEGNGEIDVKLSKDWLTVLNRWLDNVVEFSGSEFVFISILLALLTWAFLGIPFGRHNDWQIVISDAQAVVNMVFDAFLMRQQLNADKSFMTTTACLKSRIGSNKRMLKFLINSGRYKIIDGIQFNKLQQSEFASELPQENWLGRITTSVSQVVGHIVTVCLYWVCIFIWIGFGAYCGWSNTWQLYINSATSALMVFVLAFLANVRERHNNYATKCIHDINEVDVALEARLRIITGDKVKNETIVISVPKRSRVQRGIDYYADLVGTLTGIAILLFFLVVWVILGPVMAFNSNWWLLIGTYAGLIGLNDGFVLRNVQNVLAGYQDAQISELSDADMDCLAVIGVARLNEERVTDQSLTCRISIAVGNVCSHEYTIILGALTIVGLLIGASVMGWTVTGQLICNVPPSIIESFFMIILIAGHNIGDARMRVNLYNTHLRRLKLYSYVNLSTEDDTPINSVGASTPMVCEKVSEEADESLRK